MKIQEINLTNGIIFARGINGVTNIKKTLKTYKVYFNDADVLTVSKRNVICRINGVVSRQVLKNIEEQTGDK